MTAVDIEAFPAAAQRRKRTWTPEERRRLTMMWGLYTVEEVAARLGRTPYGVYARAGVLGLPRGLQPGTESLKAAARRTGYSVYGLTSILRWYRVKMDRPISFSRVAGVPRCKLTQVDSDEVDEAVAAWLQLEIVAQAAARRGLEQMTLRRWLEAAGEKRPPKGQTWRLSTETIDRVVAERRRIVLDEKSREAIREAAVRVGISQQTLARHLKRAGFTAPRRRMSWLLKREDVDRVVANLPADTKARIARCRKDPAG